MLHKCVVRRTYGVYYAFIPMYADVNIRVIYAKKEVDVFSTRTYPFTIDVVYTYIQYKGKKPIIFINMAHKVFIRHTYIYQCDSCGGEWKINEAENIERLNCPHCGKSSDVEYVHEDQRRNHYRRHI